jgi:3',5'-cyclic AMP phosphodiesterase CpdA
MYRIIHLSDIHFGRLRPTLAERLTQIVQALRPDAVVITGDITQRARSEQFRAASAFLAALPKPLILTPGNHDVPLYRVHKRFFAPLRGYTKHVLPLSAGSSSHESALIVPIDSTRRFTIDGGRVSPAELARAKAAFASAPAGALKIASLHHPVVVPHDVSAKKRLQNAQETLHAFAEMGVDVVLSGHTHRPFVDIVDVRGVDDECHILAVTAGSAISGRDRDWGNSFYSLAITGAQLEVNEFRYSPETEQFAASAKENFARRAPGAWSRA